MLSVSTIFNVSMSVEKWLLTGYLLKVAAKCAILWNEGMCSVVGKMNLFGSGRWGVLPPPPPLGYAPVICHFSFKALSFSKRYNDTLVFWPFLYVLLLQLTAAQRTMLSIFFHKSYQSHNPTHLSFFMAWCKSGTKISGPETSGACDPGPGTPIKA